jgi:ribosomal protein L15
MSEVQSRPAAPRGRGSARGGRGGFSSRGGRGGRGHATNGDKTGAATTSIEDEGEVGILKRQYGSKVSTIKEMFPDWTDEDVVFALQETDGDLETTVDRITDGKPQSNSW